MNFFLSVKEYNSLKSLTSNVDNYVEKVINFVKEFGSYGHRSKRPTNGCLLDVGDDLSELELNCVYEILLKRIRLKMKYEE